MTDRPYGIAGVLAAVLAVILAACAAPEARAPEPGARPASPAFLTAVPAGTTAYDNASLARLFTRLTFETEWGAERARLVRYEAPVIVGLSGPGAARYADFLEGYVGFLRRHAGIAISRGDVGANLHVRFVAARAFERVLPAAACVLTPGDLAWEEYARAPDALGGDAIVSATRIEEMTVFLPQTAPPHAVRACLIEEVAQALGPVNDLFGLGPSIFNDDFGHIWPTRLDLLMLRTLYAPELETGLSRASAEVAAARALARLNPAGRSAPPLQQAGLTGAAPWRRMMGEVVSRAMPAQRVAARAEQALAFAQAAMPNTPQHCHSLITLGRVLSQTKPDRAVALLDEAGTLCARVHGAEDPRIAWARIEEAAAYRALGRPADVLRITQGLAAPLAAYGLEERLAALYALRAEAYLARGERVEADRARRGARAWGAYAFGQNAVE